MHQAAFQFVRGAVAQFDPSDKHVVELGSYIVNGTVRPIFSDTASYVGVDLRDGPGVDIVGDAARWLPEQPVDIVVTAEMLEHSPDPSATVLNIGRMLKPGGVLILTAAGVERVPHNNDGHAGEAAVANEPYTPIEEEWLRNTLQDAGFESIQVTRNERQGDIYATATRPELAVSQPARQNAPRRGTRTPRRAV